MPVALHGHGGAISPAHHARARPRAWHPKKAFLNPSAIHLTKLTKRKVSLMASLIHAWLPVLAIWLCASGLPKPAEDAEGSYVEIDFSALPSARERSYSLTVTIYTSDKDIDYSAETKVSRADVDPPHVMCQTYAVNMELNRFKTKIVDKTKLRIYGRNFNDKLIPAIEGKVTSPDLRKEELPKVKNPPKA